MESSDDAKSAVAANREAVVFFMISPETKMAIGINATLTGTGVSDQGFTLTLQHFLTIEGFPKNHQTTLSSHQNLTQKYLKSPS